ncbi:MAG: hypothetical protein JXA20_11020 [Spirochaetes bacterium]|nr:hypothetical protein [Spirochaetota bacterium]
MQREVKFDRVEGFIGEMKRIGVDKIAFCETSERRAVQESPEVLSVMPVVMLELLAYRDAVLYKCVLRDIDLDATYDLLVARGFEVTRSTRNIT